jgi:lysophospholipase L1-like esterase
MTNRPYALRISILLNVCFFIGSCILGYVYRDKVFQKLVHLKGKPTIVMFGNSITAQGKWVELLGRTDVMNSGLAGFCTYHFLDFIEEVVLQHQPKVCFVMGGINDITVGVAAETIQNNYQKILESMQDHQITPVVTLTLYQQNDPINNQKVTALNQFLIQYCTLHQIQYIDINPHLSDSTGLKPEFAIDKTHLNPKAYQIWSEEILKVLQQMKI